MYQLSEFTFREILSKSAALYGSRPALRTVSGKGLSYTEFRAKTGAISAFLAANGVKKGDRVALVSENRPEWGCAYFAITAMGAIVVPILTDFLPGQMGNILAHAECSMVLVSMRLREKLVAYSSSALIILLDTMEAISGALASPYNESATYEYGPISEDDSAAIIYTSGTTGHSKGVVLSQKNIVYNAWSCRYRMRLHRFDRLLSILPLGHTYECTVGFVYPIMQGCSISYLDRPPTPSALAPAFAAVHPTIMLSVPLVIEKLVKANVFPKLKGMKAASWPIVGDILHRLIGKKLIKALGGRLRWFGIGGAALSKEVEAFLLKARFPFSVGYGLTETAPLISGNPPWKTRAGSCGFPIPGLELRIADISSASGEGEIQVRGPTVMKGYYRDEAKTKESLSPDGWFKTGDLGHLTAEGRLSIRGRLKTMILGPSGENIYPEEIETVINALDPVQESLVYSDSDGAIVALVQIKPEFLANLRGELQDRVDSMSESLGSMGDAMTQALDTLRKEANSRLVSFSRITKIVYHEEAFEKTPTLKIKRYLYPLTKSDPTRKAKEGVGE